MRSINFQIDESLEITKKSYPTLSNYENEKTKVQAKKQYDSQLIKQNKKINSSKNNNNNNGQYNDLIKYL